MGGAEALCAVGGPICLYLGVLLARHGAQTRRCHVCAANGLDLFNATEFRLGEQLGSKDKHSVI